MRGSRTETCSMKEAKRRLVDASNESKMYKRSKADSFIEAILSSSAHGIENALVSMELDTLDTISRRVNELQRIVDVTRKRRKKEDIASRRGVPSCSRQGDPPHTTPALTTSQAIPTEALRRLMFSGFFAPAELGKVLLLVSKSFVCNLGPETVWDLLFQLRWPKLYERLPKSTEYNTLFRRLSRGERIESNFVFETPLKSPALLENQLVFFVSIRDANDTDVFSHVLDDHRRGMLLNNGIVSFPLDRLILVYKTGAHSNARQGECGLASPYAAWKVYLHCVRLDTGQSCCLHEASEIEHIFHTNSQAMVRMGSKRKVLTTTTKGKLLEDRIDCFEKTRNTAYMGIFLETSMRSSSNLYHSLYLQFKKRTLYGDGSGEGYKCSYFDPLKECLSHGVTLLHLLEALDLWV
jgi:hypothetical protein